MTPTGYTQSPAAKRTYRKLRQRPYAFVPLCSSAGAQLAALPADVECVYLVGPRPESWPLWALSGVPEHWRADRHYYDGSPVMRYVRPADGRRVELHAAAVWYGAGRYTAGQAADAFDVLGAGVRRAFGYDVALLATPATLGRELFLRTIPAERAYPVLDDDEQQLLRDTSGQGRIELLPPAAAELPALWEYDGRLMYAALCWGLPDGPPDRVADDVLDDIDEHAPSWQRVAVQVPRDWRQRFGLLGFRDEFGWSYPCEPAQTFTTWAGGAEVLLARRHGWRVDTLRAFVWPARTGRRGPLDTWAAKLVRLRADVARHAAEAGHGAEVVALARNAVRALLLHGIGAFHGAPHRVTRSAHVLDAYTVPEGVRPRLEGEYLIWAEHRAAAWPALSHPEWSSTIWSRARARLLSAPLHTGALHRDAGDVIAFRTDAVYLTAQQRRWRDDGTVGRYRLKRRSTWERGPAWPASNRELLDVREQCSSADTDDWRQQ